MILRQESFKVSQYVIFLNADKLLSCCKRWNKNQTQASRRLKTGWCRALVAESPGLINSQAIPWLKAWMCVLFCNKTMKPFVSNLVKYGSNLFLHFSFWKGYYYRLFRISSVSPIWIHCALFSTVCPGRLTWTDHSISKLLTLWLLVGFPGENPLE